MAAYRICGSDSGRRPLQHSRRSLSSVSGIRVVCSPVARLLAFADPAAVQHSRQCTQRAVFESESFLASDPIKVCHLLFQQNQQGGQTRCLLTDPTRFHSALIQQCRTVLIYSRAHFKHTLISHESLQTAASLEPVSSCVLVAHLQPRQHSACWGQQVQDSVVGGCELHYTDWVMFSLLERRSSFLSISRRSLRKYHSGGRCHSGVQL